MTDPTTFTSIPLTTKPTSRVRMTKAAKAALAAEAAPTASEPAPPPPAPAPESAAPKGKRGPKTPMSQEHLERLAAARTKAVEVRRVKAEERRMKVAQVMDRILREKELKLEARTRANLEQERVRKIAEARLKGSSRQIIVEDDAEDDDLEEDEPIEIPPPRPIAPRARSAPMAAPQPTTIAAPPRVGGGALRRFLF